MRLVCHFDTASKMLQVMGRSPAQGRHNVDLWRFHPDAWDGDHHDTVVRDVLAVPPGESCWLCLHYAELDFSGKCVLVPSP